MVPNRRKWPVLKKQPGRHRRGCGPIMIQNRRGSSGRRNGRRRSEFGCRRVAPAITPTPSLPFRKQLGVSYFQRKGCFMEILELEANTRNIGFFLLHNVGFDAKIEDCKLFLARNLPGKCDSVTESTLEHWRREYKKECEREGRTPELLVDRLNASAWELCRTETGREIVAGQLIRSPEGRMAIREAMRELPLEGLREIFGIL